MKRARSAAWGLGLAVVIAACGRQPLLLGPDGPGAPVADHVASGGAAGAAGAIGGTTGAAGSGASGAAGVSGSGGAAGRDGGPPREDELAPLGAPCVEASDCAKHFCVGGVCCDVSCQGPCLTCAGPARGICAPLAAGATCAPQRCDGAMGSDRSFCDGQGVCQAGAPFVCAPFACDQANGRCFSACDTSAQCSNASCTNGSCGGHIPAAECSTGVECASGFCAAGVCCNSLCEGSCRSCALPGSVGICTPVPSGNLDGKCDDGGPCQGHPAGTVCSTPSCVGSSFTGPGRCDATGACVLPATFSCAPYACDEANAQCFTTCETSAQCLNASCTNNSCGVHSDGVCSSNAECASGLCADGVCCDSPCQGPCVSCALPGSIGICTPVPLSHLDPHALCQDRGAASCASNGRCDGGGGCQRYPAGTMCAKPSCVGATFTAAGTCSAAGACLVPEASSCAPLTCRDDIPMCHIGCPSGDSICPVGAYCSGDETCQLRRPSGAPCAGDHECLSSRCVLGFCAIP